MLHKKDFINNRHAIFFVQLFIVLLLSSCRNKQHAVPLFTKMDLAQTHINFNNKLSYDKYFNIYTYRNFYNGGGVAIGDVNNDGRPDIFMTANMEPNKLYLNNGNFQFEDVTTAAGIGKKGKWSTGVSMADVNGDGWLDIYVCNSGDIKEDQKENELYIINGVVNGEVSFTERGEEFGLS